MRTLTLLVALCLAGTALLALAPGAAAQNVYCTDPKGTSWSCPGTVCADVNRDGRFTYRECVDLSTSCPHGCCGVQACPPPA